jgi:hypothetical protein
VVGFAVAVQFIGERVNASVLLLVVFAVFGMLHFQLVLEGVDLSAEGKLTLLLLDLLVLLVPNEVLDLLIFVSEQPVEFVNVGNEGVDLLVEGGAELAGVFLLQIAVLDLDVDNLRHIDFLKFQNLLSQRVVVEFQSLEFLLVAVAKSLVFGELVFELSVFVVVGIF